MLTAFNLDSSILYMRIMESSMYFLLLLFPFCHALPQRSESVTAKCSSFEHNGYSCVPYFLCNDTGYINTDGEGIFDPRESTPLCDVEVGNINTDGEGDIDIRNIDDVEVFHNHEDIINAKCNGLIQVCCKHPRHCKKGNFAIKVDPKILYKQPKPKCGNRNIGGLVDEPVPFPGGNIEKGSSRFGEWPHVCAVMKEEMTDNGNTESRYTCVGSLISKEVVLTAAHCVKKASESNVKIRVRCGDWDRSNENEIYPHQERAIKDTIIHPDFGEKNLHNNFALLITEEDFKLSDHISPVCLPSTGDKFKPQDCVSSGWGKDSLNFSFETKGEYQNVLKEIHLPLVGHQECQRRLRETRLDQYFKLDDSFICAGGEPGVDTCKGDGGGPLTCRHGESGPWVQVGIVSWGIGCGDDIPAVYADVAKAACWIDKTVSCHLQKLYVENFSASRFVPSHFGFTQDDCPGYLPGDSPVRCPANESDYDDYDYGE